jgi:hypothetical protein
MNGRLHKHRENDHRSISRRATANGERRTEVVTTVMSGIEIEERMVIGIIESGLGGVKRVHGVAASEPCAVVEVCLEI